ncbi:MAG: nucleoside triphosphate pyrophosphohydrolase [Granulosicoccus sp.]
MEKDDEPPVEQLRRVMQQLRDPVTGCQWDVRQNFRTIAPYTLEEAYEVVDAIERGDLDDLKDELGDLLLQVVFHAQMASEQSAFDFDDVAQAIVEKMIRRHPHVFADTRYQSEAEMKSAWDAHKATERLARQTRLAESGQVSDSQSSSLDGVARNLPALKRADKIQMRAARVGFDWHDIAPVWDKLEEEIDELKQALRSEDQAAVQDELGDLLFTVVNLARHAKVDSEAALREATAKFDARFRQVECLAAKSNKTLDGFDMDELEKLWTQAKALT